MRIPNFYFSGGPIVGGGGAYSLKRVPHYAITGYILGLEKGIREYRGVCVYIYRYVYGLYKF